MTNETDGGGIDGWYERAYGRLSLPVIVTDLDASIVYVNAAFTRISGYRPDELLGQNPRMLQSGLTQPEVFRQMWQALAAGGEWHGQLVNRRKSGETYVESLHISPLVDASGQPTHYLGLWLDVTDDVTEREWLRWRGQTDELSGALNRRGLIESLDAELHRARRHGRPLVAMLADLDDFKAINDRNGHAAGDAVLRAAAQAIMRTVRAEDIVGRYGGDEFLVLLPDTTAATAGIVANRVVAAVHERGTAAAAVHGGERLEVSCSVGFVAVEGLVAPSLDELVRRLDPPLHAAKSAGKNRARTAESDSAAGEGE